MFPGLGISLSARFLFDSMAVVVCYCVTYALTQTTGRGEQSNCRHSRCHELKMGKELLDYAGVGWPLLHTAGQTQYKYWGVRSCLVIPCKSIITEEHLEIIDITQKKKDKLFIIT